MNNIYYFWFLRHKKFIGKMYTKRRQEQTESKNEDLNDIKIINRKHDLFLSKGFNISDILSNTFILFNKFSLNLSTNK